MTDHTSKSQNEKRTAEYLFKISVTGSSRQLQTQFIRSFVGGDFIPDHLTGGCDISTMLFQVDSINVKLILQDISGKKIFTKLRPKYYRGSSAAIISFDMEDRASFKAVEDWYKEFRKFVPHSTVPIVLIGLITKSKTVTTIEGQNLAEELGTHYYEIQIMDKRNIEGIFHDLIRRLLEDKS